MNRIDRLFGILTLLQSRKYISAEKIAERFDMSREDAAPDLAFNENIWQAVRGEHSRMPAPRRSAAVREAKAGREEEEEGVED